MPMKIPNPAPPDSSHPNTHSKLDSKVVSYFLQELRGRFIFAEQNELQIQVPFQQEAFGYQPDTHHSPQGPGQLLRGFLVPADTQGWLWDGKNPLGSTTLKERSRRITQDAWISIEGVHYTQMGISASTPEASTPLHSTRQENTFSTQICTHPCKEVPLVPPMLLTPLPCSPPRPPSPWTPARVAPRSLFPAHRSSRRRL